MTEWISVKDRLPDDDQCVLVIDRDSHTNGPMNIVSVIYNAECSLEYRWEIDHFCESSYAGDVTHWMPLPEPPNE